MTRGVGRSSQGGDTKLDQKSGGGELEIFSSG